LPLKKIVEFNESLCSAAASSPTTAAPASMKPSTRAVRITSWKSDSNVSAEPKAASVSFKPAIPFSSLWCQAVKNSCR
jgi:hypothetical protein